MSVLADRLRSVVRPVSPAQARPLPRAAADVVDVLGAAWDDAAARRFATIDRVYRPGYRHGSVAMADGLPPVGGWSRLRLLAGAPCGERLLFVDLETTGLAGGAGTQAFLVGCAWFDGGTFRVRQFLLTSPHGERALLDAVATVADECDAVVTYNGKSFDLPLIETRFLYQRMETPFAGKPHVDLLHTARRLWRADGGRADAERGDGGRKERARSEGEARPRGHELERAVSSGCRLSELERVLCGHERDGDVPGFEIPSRYFHYVRTGDASPLVGVIEHNRLDLVSLALLTARAAQLLHAGPTNATSSREALGLGRLYERGGLTAEARESYLRALELAPHPARQDSTNTEALRALAMLARRERRYEEAAEAWRRALALPHCPAHVARQAAEALAVHHEHRLRDPRVAHGFALRSLDGMDSLTRRLAVEKRLARLQRKLDLAPALPQESVLPELGAAT